MTVMKSWSIPLGKVFGVELRLHLSFLFLVMFILFPLLDPSAAVGAGKGMALIGIITLSVLLHELGHIFAGNTRGVSPKAVMVLPIGGVPLRDGSDLSKSPGVRDEVFTALAGPIANLIVAGSATLVAFALRPNLLQNLLAQPYLSVEDPLKSFIWVNVGLAVLNLLPAYPLDGGRILRAFLADPGSGPDHEGMSYSAATRRAVMIGQAFAMFLIFAGIRNTWLMLIGFFLFVAVQIEDRSLLFQSVIESVRLEEIMLTDFSTLSPADTLEDALNKAVHSLQDDFPVIRGSDMVGVISKQNILRALRDEGNGYVQSAMKKAFETATKNDSLAAAFRKITKGTTIIPVVDENRLVGIVTLQNLMHSMGLLAESRKLQREEE
jgi:Zn-dependent protease/CBS domain-containing protein